MNKSNFVAVLVLAGMFLLMFFSSLDNSATFDEVAHIGAGYSYVTQKDGRLNPEHPPLIKIISAIPLLFLKLNFSINRPFWNMQNVNDRQWAAGSSLLYESGNDADKILFWARLPIMFLAILFGWIIFWWTRKNYGAKTALVSLALFALSPTFLAHSTLVATDLGAAFAFFLSVIFFIRFLEKNDKKSAIYFGIVFGLSLLVKFSLVILLPFFVILIICSLIRNSKLEIRNLALTAAVAFAVIYIFYIPQVLNYPADQNLADAHFTLAQYKTAQFAPKFDFWFLSNEITRPFGQYLHGFLMAAQRTAGGNSAYFLGEISSKGWISYFPVLFFTKEQIGLYILIFLAIILGIKNRKQPKDPKITTFLLFIAYYWVWSLWSPLNIGIRHILPTFPFIYILISKSIIGWIFSKEDTPLNPKKFFVSVLFFWILLEIIFAFPYFISYYNEFGGSIKNGYKIATDSNYDWGQDLKRLKFWVEKNNVEKVYLDYFGGGSPKYYLGDRYEFWRYEKGAPPAGSYFAVSANSLTGAENLYYWLKDKQPIARAGSSIFIYRISNI